MFMTERDEIGQNEELEDEPDLANFIINKYSLAYGEYYYGINLISRNLKVTPDIDLLNVNINEYHPEENTAVGFELKVLKYHSRRKRIELSSFYQGDNKKVQLHLPVRMPTSNPIPGMVSGRYVFQL